MTDALFRSAAELIERVAQHCREILWMPEGDRRVDVLRQAYIKDPLSTPQATGVDIPAPRFANANAALRFKLRVHEHEKQVLDVARKFPNVEVAGFDDSAVVDAGNWLGGMSSLHVTFGREQAEKFPKACLDAAKDMVTVDIFNVTRAGRLFEARDAQVLEQLDGATPDRLVMSTIGRSHIYGNTLLGAETPGWVLAMNAMQPDFVDVPCKHWRAVLASQHCGNVMNAETLALAMENCAHFEGLKPKPGAPQRATAPSPGPGG